MKLSYYKQPFYTYTNSNSAWFSLESESKQLYIEAALNWLYDKGYITGEEKRTRCSERLRGVSTALTTDPGSLIVMLFFEDNEWFFSVNVDSDFVVTRVELNDGIPTTIYPK